MYGVAIAPPLYTSLLFPVGLVDISDDPCYRGIYDEDRHDPDPTYEPDAAEEQKLFSQYAENILLKITSYLTSVRQHENLFTFEGTHSLSNVVRLTEDVLEMGTYQRLQQRLSRHTRLVKKHLGRKVELARDLAYLKLISFLVPFLIGLKKKMRIPDLSQMLLPVSGLGTSYYSDLQIRNKLPGVWCSIRETKHRFYPILFYSLHFLDDLRHLF